MAAIGQPLPCDNLTVPAIGLNMGIANVSLGVLNNTTSIEEGVSREYDSVGVAIPNLSKCNDYALTVTFASGSRDNRLWIDWNEDGDFFDIGEAIEPTIIGNQAFYDFVVPFHAPLGNKIMRVASGGREPLTNPCDAFDLGGDIEDYKVNVVEDNMQIDSVVVEQVNSCFTLGLDCQPILKIAVYTSGTANPVRVTDFNFNTNGSTNITGDVSNAKVIYTGDGSPVFSCNTTFGTVVSPSGGFNISGDQLLNSTVCKSVHYFWLVYDIPLGATPGNLIDAENLNISVIRQAIPEIHTPDVSAPMGAGVIASPVEICDNGIDDDCDGLIDCFDGDCSGVGQCISEISNFFYGLDAQSCTTVNLPADSNREIRKEWSISFPPRSPSGGSRYGSVVIGDLDNDGISEIVLNTSATNLAIIDGKTGLVKRNITQPDHPASLGLLADADGNGSGEIYWTLGSYSLPIDNRNQLICYDYATSSVLWGPIDYPLSLEEPLSIADFNGDGIPELFDNKYIINSLNGDLMGTFGTGMFLTAESRRSVAIDVLPDSYCESCSGLEIVVGTQIFSVDINGNTATTNEVFSFEDHVILQDFPAEGRRISSFVDINNDNLLDIVTVSDNLIFSWDPRTYAIIDSFSIGRLPFLSSDDYKLSSPSIDDIDNDGDLDFVFTITDGVTRLLVALDDNFNFLWRQNEMGEISKASLPTIFDLNGDGNKEIVFKPESNITNIPISPFVIKAGRPYVFVLDAATGNPIDSVYCRHNTSLDDTGAMIADVDRDGEVEIISVGFPDTTNQFLQLMVIGSCETEWMCGRTMWNQDNYNASFVNDNLTIPRHQQNHGVLKAINTWGNQVSFLDTAGRFACPLPDIVPTIDSATYRLCDTINVSITVCNNGRKSIREPGCPSNSKTLYVSYYNGDPLINSMLIKTDTLPSSLDTVGSCISYNTDLYAPTRPFDLYIVVNDSGNNSLVIPNIGFSECNTTNNFANIIVQPNDIVIIDEVTICEGDSIFLANNFQTVSGIYIDSVTTSQGCDSINRTTLTVSPYPDATILPQNLMCWYDDPIELSAVDTGGVWTGSGIVDSLEGVFDPQIANTGTNMVEYIIGGDCPDSSDITIIVGAGSEITAVLTNDSCSQLLGAIDLTLQGIAPFSINWSNETTEEDLFGLGLGEYSVIVTDSMGCITEESYFVDDMRVNCSRIYIPNSFTPNEDGANDTFYPRLIGITNQNYRFIIYDRWGEQVFQSNQIYEGWDGFYKGNVVQNGVYIWKLFYQEEGGNEIYKALGNVNVIR